MSTIVYIDFRQILDSLKWEQVVKAMKHMKIPNDFGMNLGVKQADELSVTLLILALHQAILRKQSSIKNASS